MTRYHEGSTSAAVAPGRHRQRRSRWVGAPATIVVGVLLAGGATTAVVTAARASACPSGSRTLTVAAAPEIARIIEAQTRMLPTGDVGDDGVCRRTLVQPRMAADVADALGAGRPAAIDVWVPDSSLWAARVAPPVVAALGQPPYPSIARSPVVLAVAAATAGRFGWPDTHPDLPALLAQSTTDRAVRLGMADPRRSAAAAAVVAAAQSAVGVDAAGRASLTAALRSRTAAPADVEHALDRLTGADPVAWASSEQAVWARGAQGALARPVAVYLGPRTATLDYPFLVLTADHARAADAARLFSSLTSAVGRPLLRAAGFRDADGTAQFARASDDVVRSETLPAADVVAGSLSADLVDASARTLAVLDQPSRMLAVLDISGSMGWPVPTAGNATRIDVARSAAAAGLALFPDDSEVGLWEFATNLTPTSDYRELAPIEPLTASADGTTGRDRLARALGAVRVDPMGDTGLYDTTLAAVRAVRSGWQPGKTNSVVLLTDGANDDRDGINLPTLLAALHREDDPARPVPVLTIGYGLDSDTKALAAISLATSGTTYRAKDASELRQVFLGAIGERLCRPDCR